MKFAVVSLLVFFASFAQAFTLISNSNSNMEGWDKTILEFQINRTNCPAGMDLDGVINNALLVWNGVPNSRLEVKLGSDTTSTTYNDPPTIVCSTTFGADTGADVNAVPGAASVQFSGARVARGLLILNVQPGAQGNIANFNRTLLEVILAHEIGHVLGIGHSELTSALMYYNASAKAHLTLAQDDMDAMAYLYPRDELSDLPYGGCGMVAPISRPPPGSPFKVLFLMLLPVLVLIRLRMLQSREQRRLPSDL